MTKCASTGELMIVTTSNTPTNAPMMYATNRETID